MSTNWRLSVIYFGDKFSKFNRMIDRSELTERIGNCMPVFFIRFILGFIYVKIKYLIEHKIILLLLNEV